MSKRIYSLLDADGDSMGLLETDCLDENIISDSWKFFIESIDELEELEDYDTDIESFIEYMEKQHIQYTFERTFYTEINC